MYKGFSTIGRYKRFNIRDFELVKRDVLNHFSIPKGQKLMNPNFGSIIWNLLFDPFDDRTKQLIEEDVRNIISYEPRVAVKNLVISQYEQGIQLDLELIYISTNQSDFISARFDREFNQLFVT